MASGKDSRTKIVLARILGKQGRGSTPATPRLEHRAVVVVVVIFYYSDMGEDCYIVTSYKKVTAQLPRPYAFRSREIELIELFSLLKNQVQHLQCLRYKILPSGLCAEICCNRGKKGLPGRIGTFSVPMLEQIGTYCRY